MNKIKEAIQTTTEAMNLLYDTLSPMPKSAIMSKLSKIKLFLESLPDLTTELENKDEVLQKIKSWCEAYPLEVFPKPDLKKADEVLKAAGMTLDAISADTIRNVLDDVKDIVEQILKGGDKIGIETEIQPETDLLKARKEIDRLTAEIMRKEKALEIAREYIGRSSSDELAAQSDIDEALKGVSNG